MAQAAQIVPMRGGLDLVTPHMQKAPGFLISALNYESEARGYRRVLGYERLDGRPKPSAAGYFILNFDAGQTEIAEDDVVTGATSGATGIALRTATVDTGTWGGGDAAGWVALYNVSGTFQDDENLQVSAATVAVANGAALADAASTDDLNTALRLEAVEKRRAAISAVPGSGPVRGIFTLSGDIYAFRDNAGATACVMHKATASGWAAQTFGHTLAFTAGTAAFSEGDTVTGGSSSATATVERVIVTGGTWGAGDAVGYLVLSGVSGTFTSSETISSAGGSATGGGAQAAITLPPGGKYRTAVHNFFGASNLRRAYCANGTGRAFEWDGSVMAPINTGLSAALDKPQFVSVHSNHLLLGYAGGAVLGSGTGLPLSFLAADGAFEIGLGEDITGIQRASRTATVITGRNILSYLVGTDSTNIELRDIADDSGAIADTLQAVGKPYFLDDIGVRDLATAQTFGDWQIGTVTTLIEPYITGRRTGGKAVTGALRVRSRSQYRLFYEDGEGVSIYFGRKNPECMLFTLGFTPKCLHSGDDADGYEILLAGDDEGWVFQLDAGTSADGEVITAYLRTTFLHQSAPNRDKRYHRAFIDVDSGGEGTALSYVADFGYGSDDSPSGVEQSTDLAGGGGIWDVATWDAFVWDASIQGQAIADLDGIGENVSLAIMSDATDEAPHTIASLTINYTPRRMQR
jgi:hypothetical protein